MSCGCTSKILYGGNKKKSIKKNKKQKGGEIDPISEDTLGVIVTNYFSEETRKANGYNVELRLKNEEEIIKSISSSHNSNLSNNLVNKFLEELNEKITNIQQKKQQSSNTILHPLRFYTKNKYIGKTGSIIDISLLKIMLKNKYTKNKIELSTDRLKLYKYAYRQASNNRVLNSNKMSNSSNISENYSSIVKNVFQGNEYKIFTELLKNPYKKEEGINVYDYIQQLYKDSIFQTNEYGIIIEQKQATHLNLKLFTVPKENFRTHCDNTKKIVDDGQNRILRFGIMPACKNNSYSIPLFKNKKTNYNLKCIPKQEKIIKVNKDNICEESKQMIQELRKKGTISYIGHICKKENGKWKILFSKNKTEFSKNKTENPSNEVRLLQSGGKKPVKKTTTKKTTTKKPVKKTTTTKKPTTKKPTTKKRVIKKSVKKASMKK